MNGGRHKELFTRYVKELISGKVFLPSGYLDAADSDKFEGIGVHLCTLDRCRLLRILAAGKEDT